MKPSTLRWVNLSEVLVFSGFVAWYIWQLQASYFFSWVVFPVWMLASFLVHGDTPKTMGWRADNLWSAAKRSAPFFACCIVGLLVVGVFMAWFFARERNIIPLAIGQGILGTLVWWAFPAVWHHGMRVGPGFYTFHPR